MFLIIWLLVAVKIFIVKKFLYLCVSTKRTHYIVVVDYNNKNNISNYSIEFLYEFLFLLFIVQIMIAVIQHLFFFRRGSL